MSSEDAAKIAMLRHTVATLAYRAGKAMRDAPANFGEFRAAATTRQAVEIAVHMGDLIEWACRGADGNATWHEATPAGWESEVNRFFTAMKRFDDRLASGAPLGVSPEKLFQGPIADALTHVGQLATLRRLAGSGVRGENYFVANIKVGCVGNEQASPVREFD
jgi:hypothetical protein